jgi:hypothetical protein
VVSDVAETVRMIFARYLTLGSVQALAQELDRCGIRTRNAGSPMAATSGMPSGSAALRIYSATQPLMRMRGP